VPINPRVSLSLPLLSDAAMSLTILRTDGSQVVIEPGAGDIVVWTLKKSASDTSFVWKKYGSLEPDGTLSFIVAAADTKNASAGLYVYDVVMSLSGKRTAVVPISPFYLEPAVTLL